MNLPAIAIERTTLTKFMVLLLLVGGIFSYFQLGRLEDPNFTVKTAVIITSYPGASPEEVELEVTDRIEQAIQEMPQLDNLYSLSKAGLSIIKVDMKQIYMADRLPQVWDEMRKKIRDIRPQLPLTASPPEILDDFSFVYGFVLAVTGDGYSYAELEDYADALKKDLSLVPGVSRAQLWGVQPKVVYLDVSEAQVAELGITTETVMATLAAQNFVVNAGSVNVPERRLRIDIHGEFDSPEDIGDVLIRRSLLDIAAKAATDIADVKAVDPRESGLIRIRDVAEVRMGYLEPPINQMRFNGQPALAISLANVAGGNIITTGEALDKRLNELLAELPAGIEVSRFQWQSDLVKESIGGFVVNLAEAVLIVLVVLTLAMGWRMGLVIGSGLILTILGTFIFMLLLGIELHRVSLGALVVALGMMVDNGIVVADGVAVRLGKGMQAKEAAIESASIPAWPLLGATVIASMAFYPVFSAKADAGEYGRTLFVVVAISLVLSWVISVTVTPLQCISVLRAPKNQTEGSDPYGGRFFVGFRNLLAGAIRNRVATLGGSAVILCVAVLGFTKVPQQFFPDSTRAQFVIDYWAPEGTPIEKVSEDLRAIEEKLANDPRTADIGTFIGSGGPRFYLPVDPEFPYQSFAQIVINTPSFKEVGPLTEEMEPWLNEHYPNVLTRVRKYTVGPGDTWPFELRITGPGNADLQALRKLGEQGMAILRETPLAKHVRTDLRQRVQKIVIDYSQERARWVAVSRGNIAAGTLRAYDGLPIGIYREGDDIYPIIARGIDENRSRAAGSLDVVQVTPTLSVKTLPLAEVSDSIAMEWEDPIIARWNRRRGVAVQAQPQGVTFPALRAAVIDKINAMELPPGYQMEWDGEYKSTIDAQLSLVPGMAPTLVIILLIIVTLFNAIKPPIIMFAAIPFALIGISGIMLPTQTPFGFMALLGAMSLMGMMIKNSIVLLDEINLNLKLGLSEYDSVVQSAVSRLRPVILGALTTVLGVMPLLQDAFWVSMSMTIMAGLTVGTAVTMILVPVLYALLYRVPNPVQKDS
jgi:multidrug efflux pump subunit AcrB